MDQGNQVKLIARGFRLSKAQLDYIADGSYGFVTRGGKSVYRELKVIAQEEKSGDAIVKESYSGDYNYEKSFVLSYEGRPEKIKPLYQTIPITKKVSVYQPS